MNAWIGIIGIVIGTFLGGGVAWFNSRFQIRHQAERDRKKFMLQKMEQIHLLLSQHKHSYKMVTAEMLKRFCSEELEEFPELAAIPSERLRMLVGFYSPELNDSFNDVERHGESYGDLIGEHLKVDGQECWTLFDTGARNTYVTPSVAQVLKTSAMAHAFRTALGGEVKETNTSAILEAEIEGHPIATHALVIDEIGKDEERQANRDSVWRAGNATVGNPTSA